MIKMKKPLLLIIGHCCLILGVIGAFLPLLPTTPFLLLAALCYSKSSDKLHGWIINHKYLGPPINDWEKNGVISFKAKLFATFMLALATFLRLPSLEIANIYKIIAGSVMGLILIFIWTRPSRSS